MSSNADIKLSSSDSSSISSVANARSDERGLTTQLSSTSDSTFMMPKRATLRRTETFANLLKQQVTPALYTSSIRTPFGPPVLREPAELEVTHELEKTNPKPKISERPSERSAPGGASSFLGAAKQKRDDLRIITDVYVSNLILLHSSILYWLNSSRPNLTRSVSAPLARPHAHSACGGARACRSLI